LLVAMALGLIALGTLLLRLRDPEP
jgi:hypothetical protein